MGAGGKRELYDLTTDPLAERDLAADNAEACAEMHGLLVDHLKACGASDAFIRLWQTA